jgi:SNF2 family DNA or RNA helicase
VKMLRTYHKLPMSGTLSADHPAGLWSPFQWLYPKDSYMRSYWNFYKSIVDFIIDPEHGYHKIIGIIPEGVERLHEFMDRFYVRHLKKGQCCPHHPDGVMPWLSEKYYETIWVDLTPAQRRVYNEMRDEFITWVGEHENDPLAAQAAMVRMLRLSQMCLAVPSVRPAQRWKVDKETGERFLEDYMDVYFEPDAPSSKIDRAIELFQDHPEKQFVVWTSSKRFMDIAVPRLAKKTSLVHVNGDVKDKARQDAIDSFAAGNQQLFFGMIQTAEGIDGLQGATDQMLFFDRTWSARQNAQAEDRLHRDGQKGSVVITDMMARDTVELGNRQKEIRKWGWMQQLLNGKINQETGE